MKVVRLICVECGLGRSPFTSACPGCESSVSVTTKVAKEVK
jgi:uncharacterized OB-fold protein